jgi:hypothetical protein
LQQIYDRCHKSFTIDLTIAAMQRFLALMPAPAVFWKFLLSMLAIDFAFLLLHILLRGLEAAEIIEEVPPLLSVFGDVGLAERFNHAKWILIIVLMAVLFRRLRVPIFLAFSAIFVLILADDALRLHERGSVVVNAQWPTMPTFGMSSAEMGEVVVWAVLGLITVPIILWGMLATRREWWPYAGLILAGLSGLVFFGVVFDMMQEPLHYIETPGISYWLLQLAGLIESAGESFFASFTTASAIAIYYALREVSGEGRRMSPAEFRQQAVTTDAAGPHLSPGE